MLMRGSTWGLARFSPSAPLSAPPSAAATELLLVPRPGRPDAVRMMRQERLEFMYLMAAREWPDCRRGCRCLAWSGWPEVILGLLVDAFDGVKSRVLGA